MRLIDADELKKHKFLTPDAVEAKKWLPVETKGYQQGWNDAIDAIVDNAPTVERPTGECKTCKYYHPYFEQFTNIPRGDGYCVIARMTPEGMTTINCNDEFGCSDYQKGGAK